MKHNKHIEEITEVVKTEVTVSMYEMWHSIS